MDRSGSEVARLLAQIDVEYRAAQLALQGFTSGTAKHSFIQARYDRLGTIYQNLQHEVGEAAMEMVVDRLNHHSESKKEKPPEALEDLLSADLHLLCKEHGCYRVLPEQVNLSSIKHVLDLRCGSGNWVFDLTHEYPDLHIFGLSGSKSRVAYAQVGAEVQRFTNVSFVEGTMDQLPFHDGSFDLLHLRWSCQPIEKMPPIFQECWRILRPGGVLLWREIILQETTSQPWQAFFDSVARLVPSCSPEQMQVLMHTAFPNPTTIASTIDGSFNSALYNAYPLTPAHFLSRIFAFLPISAQEEQELLTRMMIDFAQQWFRLLFIDTTLIGAKSHEI